MNFLIKWITYFFMALAFIASMPFFLVFVSVLWIADKVRYLFKRDD